MSEPRTTDDWADLYEELRPVYEAFADKLEELMKDLLDAEDIGYSWVGSWCYPVDRFRDQLYRVRREGVEIEDPFDGSLELAGVWVVLDTSRSRAGAADLIAREFNVDSARSLSIEDAETWNKRLRAAEHVRYAYPYFSVALDDRREELPEWSRYADLRVRIDLATLLQHASQRFDYALPFYWESSYPTEVRDALGRAGARLAGVDEDLADAIDELSKLEGDYEEAIAAGDVVLPLNGTSLTAYLARSPTVQELLDIAELVGMRPDREYEPGQLHVEQGLLWLLRRADLQTLAELDHFLIEARPRAEAIYADIARLSREREFDPWAVADSVVEWLWLVLRREDAEAVSLLQYMPQIEEALNMLIGNPLRNADAEAAE